MNDKAVLFVDDEESILNSLKRLLRKEPYLIHTALGGEAGLELLEENTVQLVVSDQRMPEMTGTQFLQKVKERWPDTIRVVLSGYAEADVIVEAINKGEVFRFISKPWKDEALKTTIRQCFDHFDMIRENRRLTEQTQRQVIQLKNLNNLLEASVESRTKCLQFSQEVVETLPLMVLGISLEEEVVLTNHCARDRLEPLRSMIPGTDMSDILPAEAVAAVRACLENTATEEFLFNWCGRDLKAMPGLLGPDDERRGCVLLLEEVGA
ncbi:response regulator [bacterium]|nr:response regulator [bacterium]